MALIGTCLSLRHCQKAVITIPLNVVAAYLMGDETLTQYICELELPGLRLVRRSPSKDDTAVSRTLDACLAVICTLYSTSS